MQPAVFAPCAFPDHALLDSGEGEKLERYGDVVLARPDPQALWPKRLDARAWKRAQLVFVRESDRGGRWDGPGRERAGSGWTLAFDRARFRVRPTPFKHVGVFPEQAPNWRWMEERLRHSGEGARVLNLFGYTGVASLLARFAGAEVTHVDASRLALDWARSNAEESGLGTEGLRWVLEDALAFARREARRGARYAGILLDPPHYGRGPKGEKWQLESGLAPLLEACGKLLAERSFLVLSSYAVGYTALSFWNLLAELEGGAVEAGELALVEEGEGGAALALRIQRALVARPLMELAVLHADNHLLVVAKPAGLPCVPDESGDESLLAQAKAWVKREKGKRGEAFLGVVHRLDRPVSGVVVFARTSKAAARLSEAFRSRAVRKTYWGVSASEPGAREGLVEQWLWKDPQRNLVRALASARAGALHARTRWRVQARAGHGREARSLLVLEPETGRPHQLRVAAATLGCPLLGDLKYGARAPLPDKSLALHARALELPHPTRGESMCFECAPPERPWWRF